MKFLIICALALASASASELPKRKVESRNIVVPAGRLEGRITRGAQAYVGQFPYQVGLRLQDSNKNQNWCGGALLNNRKVLTAAHCTEGVQVAVVYLGATHREHPQVVHTVYRNNLIIHSGWNKDTLENDIAIVNIPHTPYNQFIQPVTLPSVASTYTSFNGYQVVASGWGRVSDYFAGVVPDLRFAHRIVIANADCERHYETIRNSNLCIATYDGVSTCSGDSGGPLVLASTKTLVGLTSFGSPQCEAGVPAVFTRVTSFLGWIKQNAGVVYQAHY